MKYIWNLGWIEDKWLNVGSFQMDKFPFFHESNYKWYQNLTTMWIKIKKHLQIIQLWGIKDVRLEFKVFFVKVC